jgi:hypothetical protein
VGVRFAIVCQGRSGSTFLEKLLDGHPEICCLGELLRVSTEERYGSYSLYSYLEIDQFLEQVHFSRAKEMAVGFKAPWEWLRHYPDAWGVFRKHGYRIVFLQRQNKLDQYLSRQLAEESGLWVSDAQYPPDLKLTIDMQHMRWFLNYTPFVDYELKAMCSRFPTIEVTYEDLVAGRKLAEVQRHLGVEPQSLIPQTTRSRTRPQRDVVANFDELVAELTGTPWEGFLNSQA